MKTELHDETVKTELFDDGDMGPPTQEQPTLTIDITPNWEQAAALLYALAERGDGAGKRTAREEMQRMGRIIDAALVLANSANEVCIAASLSSEGEGVTISRALIDKVRADIDAMMVAGRKA